jgi:hypothetical protein
MDGPVMLADSHRNMKTQPPPVKLPAVPNIGVAEARQLLDLALQKEALTAQDEIPDDAKHRALSELTGSSIMLPTRKP